jgi:folate-binding protein YgfZ
LLRLADAPQVPQRYLLLQRLPPAASIEAALAVLTPESEAYFWWTQIDAGLPTVLAQTQEKFVPQMINFEVLGGVNFKKGCYPGQEVVARSQYLGKLRRRMQIAHVSAAAVAAGADVFAADADEPIGTVVQAEPAPTGGTDLLFEGPAARFDDDLRLESRAGPRLLLRALPYELRDVTA